MKLRTIKKIIKVKNKKIIIKAIFLTAKYRMLILIIPMKKLSKYLGQYNEESEFNLPDETYKYVYCVGKIVNKVAGHTPWKSTCLVKALTAQKLLNDKLIESTIYLGVNKGEKNNLKAHAWLRCGRVYITGSNEKDDFHMVGKFKK